MPFAILTVDKPGATALRSALRQAHLDYLAARQDVILAGGGLLNDEAGQATGGLILLDTEDPTAARRFVDEDPFTRGGLHLSVEIRRWRKTFFDRQRIG